MLSKLGYCSRSQAVSLIRAGRVRLNGATCRDPEKPVRCPPDLVQVDEGCSVTRAKSLYLMLNKPRGLVTTRADEQGRATVYSCFEGQNFSHLSPVGRLDKASEGLLLFTNDTAWAHTITAPESHLPKTYHVQVNGQLTAEQIQKLATTGVPHDDGMLRLQAVSLLKHGSKNTWLAITLLEGKNRHIRRVLEAQELEVLRLVRISIGPLKLGPLAKGEWRFLTQAEMQQLQRQLNA
jgi:23S rRNA pseudouridine2605 synthase